MTTTSDDDTKTTTTKPVKEIPLIRDEGFFTHTTGDTYNGFFEAKKKDLTIKMFGPGVYTTAEGDIYTGTWESDRLGANEPVNITFTDKASYTGPLKEWRYSGLGKYTYPDESVLACEFSDNCPTGKMVFSDPNGQIWLGKADPGFGWFSPVNHFYTSLEGREHPKMKQRKRKAKEFHAPVY